MKRMLVSATQQDEICIAFAENNTLYDLDVESFARKQRTGNIYKAKTTRVQEDLASAFLEYGNHTDGFLSLKHAVPRPTAGSPLPSGGGLPAAGDEILVQVIKDRRRNKGAQLSTLFSLRSRHLILHPNNPNPNRKLFGYLNRNEHAALWAELPIPEGMGVSIKVASMHSQAGGLNKELDYLLKLWQAIQQAGAKHAAPCLLYESECSPIRVLQDYLTEPVDEIVVDEPETYKGIQQYIELQMPEYHDKVTLYEDTTPLFKEYKIDRQFEQAFNRTVTLPSGGTIVIDATEALVAIDVNSAKAKGSDSQQTTLTANLEAAVEICRQLRIRDLSGLIVVDFIGMSQREGKEDALKVYERMKQELKKDRAMTRTTDISAFGLIEIERQRLRISLQETVSAICPLCQGQGHIMNVANFAIKILQKIKDKSIALEDDVANINLDCSPEVASYLFNSKRREIADIESRSSSYIAITANPNLRNEEYIFTGAQQNTNIQNLLNNREGRAKRSRGRTTATNQPASHTARIRMKRPSLYARLRGWLGNRFAKTGGVKAPPKRGSRGSRKTTRAADPKFKQRAGGRKDGRGGTSRRQPPNSAQAAKPARDRSSAPANTTEGSAKRRPSPQRPARRAARGRGELAPEQPTATQPKAGVDSKDTRTAPQNPVNTGPGTPGPGPKAATARPQRTDAIRASNDPRAAGAKDGQSQQQIKVVSFAKPVQEPVPSAPIASQQPEKPPVRASNDPRAGVGEEG